MVGRGVASHATTAGARCLGLSLVLLVVVVASHGATAVEWQAAVRSSVRASVEANRGVGEFMSTPGADVDGQQLHDDTKPAGIQLVTRQKLFDYASGQGLEVLQSRLQVCLAEPASSLGCTCTGIVSSLHGGKHSCVPATQITGMPALLMQPHVRATFPS